MVKGTWRQFRNHFALLTLLAVPGVPSVAAGQQQAPPLSAQNLVELLETGMPEARILQMVAEACVIRGADPAFQRQLELAGASQALRRTAGAFACSEEIVSPPSGTLGVGFGDDQFALISAGTFQMGSTSGSSDEQPVHTVAFTRSFYMQRTEVTQGQWREIMGTNPSNLSLCGDTCPVVLVSWNDIQQFLTALNARVPGRNYRLPTEAEWEYAARAGTTGDYSGTGVLNDMGWYSRNSGNRTHPVAQKKPNAWGLYDMHGNVSEWVQDWFSASYYGGSPGVDPAGPSTGSLRVLRGGSWGVLAYDARSAYRSYNSPSNRYDYIGFRLARTP